MSPERRERKSTYEYNLLGVILQAKEVMYRDGHHPHALIVEGSKKDIIAQIPEVPEGKIAFLRSVGQEAVTIGEIGQLRQVFIISEELINIRTNDQSKVKRSQSPQNLNRKEVLVISAIQIKERKKYKKIFETIRDKDLKVVRFEELFLDNQKGNKLVKIPLVDAFVEGFRTASRIRYN